MSEPNPIDVPAAVSSDAGPPQTAADETPGNQSTGEPKDEQERKEGQSLAPNTSVPPKSDFGANVVSGDSEVHLTIVETEIGECLREIHASVLVVMDDASAGDDALSARSVGALHTITSAHVLGLLTRHVEIRQATGRRSNVRRHKASMAVVRAYARRLASRWPETTDALADWEAFVRETVGLVKSMHVCLSVATLPSARRAERASFCSERGAQIS